MEASAAPEPPNEQGFADLTGRLDEGPVTMLNLLAFKPDGGRERYLEYGEAVAPLLQKAGGRLVFQGRPRPPYSASGRGTSSSWSNTRLAAPSSR